MSCLIFIVYITPLCETDKENTHLKYVCSSIQMWFDFICRAFNFVVCCLHLFKLKETLIKLKELKHFFIPFNIIHEKTKV
jgi:hypothetical protein